MFKTKTLFILGAGASAPYGYPIGKPLIDIIIQDMEDYIFIPKQLKIVTPSSSGDDKKNNATYGFNDGIKHLEEIAPYVEKIEQHHFQQTHPNETYQIHYQPNSQEEYSSKFFLKAQIRQLDEFAALKNALEILDPVSIDAFLRDNPSYARVGKMMILYSLLKREDPLKFNMNQSNDNWYSLLLNDLVSECADNPYKLTENKIKFITFNYDVSLDYFLRSRIKKIENFIKNDEKSQSPADSFLSELNIEHIYGQLYPLVKFEQYGKYIDISEDNKLAKIQFSDSRSPSRQSFSSPSTSPKLIQNFKRFIFSFEQHSNIKTMYDERNNSTERDLVIVKNNDELRWAEEIIFIGFGFDSDNLNMLGFPNTLSDYIQMLRGKTIRYLNYKGMMKSLAFEFENIQMERHALLSPNSRKDKSKIISIIQSMAETISSAYQNDFKKFLFK
ncbi:hypothetical protein SAMN02746093_02841 [Legionella quinlivanii DSM 21216]|uniref:hypothetical protein n=1 Tax=Legionella quinlivanii TaxID=45073 RepID=UPI00089F1EA6|nr:hypothetical protein [Legionella quinlivanii]SEG40875.1 hypothetical protein SAMN02746093_02841 [Legionella quinlivanii DSM 21216]